jgi:hypothetical protein
MILATTSASTPVLQSSNYSPNSNAFTSSNALTSSESTPTVGKNGTGGLSTGSIGAIVGSIAAVLIVAMVMGGFIWYKLKIHQSTPSEEVVASEKGPMPPVFAQNKVDQDGTRSQDVIRERVIESHSGALRYPDNEVVDSGRTIFQ